MLQYLPACFFVQLFWETCITYIMLLCWLIIHFSMNSFNGLFLSRKPSHFDLLFVDLVEWQFCWSNLKPNAKFKWSLKLGNSNIMKSFHSNIYTSFFFRWLSIVGNLRKINFLWFNLAIFVYKLVYKKLVLVRNVNPFDLEVGHIQTRPLGDQTSWNPEFV